MRSCDNRRLSGSSSTKRKHLDYLLVDIRGMNPPFQIADVGIARADCAAVFIGGKHNLGPVTQWSPELR